MWDCRGLFRGRSVGQSGIAAARLVSALADIALSKHGTPAQKPMPHPA